MAVDICSTSHPAGVARTHRRTLLLGASGALWLPGRTFRGLRGGRSRNLDPDHELVGACARFDELETQVRERLEAGHSTTTPALAQLLTEQEMWLDRIVTDPATSLSGIRRKTSTLLGWADDLLDPSDLWDRRLTGSILRDLHGLDPTGIAVASGAVA